MGFSFDISVSAITVFLQGILSVFSPCVLPILPVYIGCLSGRLGQQGIDGEARYGRKKVITALKGQCLHAQKIGFIHPTTSEYLEFTSDIPETFSTFVNKIRKSY